MFSTVTALMRSAFSDTKSPAFMNLDWSKADASRTIAVLLLFELRAVRVSAGNGRSFSLALVESLTGPAFGCDRQAQGPTRRSDHQAGELFHAAKIFSDFGNGFVMYMQDDLVAGAFESQHGGGEQITCNSADDVLRPQPAVST